MHEYSFGPFLAVTEVTSSVCGVAPFIKVDGLHLQFSCQRVSTINMRINRVFASTGRLVFVSYFVVSSRGCSLDLQSWHEQTNGESKCIDTSWLPSCSTGVVWHRHRARSSPELYTRGAQSNLQTPTVSAGQVTTAYPGLLNCVSG